MKIIGKLFKVSIFAAGLAALTVSKANAIPTGTITTPANGSYSVGDMVATGTCVPSAGTTITSVRLQLRRNADTKYWKYTTQTWETSASNWLPATISGNTWYVSEGILPVANFTGSNFPEGNYLLTMEITDSASAHNATPYPKAYFDAYFPPRVTGSLSSQYQNPVPPFNWFEVYTGTYTITAGAPALDRIEYNVRRNSDNKYWNSSTSAWQVAEYGYTATTNATSYTGGAVLPNGSDTFKVRVYIYDVEGNVGTTSFSYSR